MKWSYPVLITVSGGYPRVQGRLLTCYSPVRRSSTPEGAFPLDLHVLSTPPAFVLSQDQTLHKKINPNKETADNKVTESFIDKSHQHHNQPQGASRSANAYTNVTIESMHDTLLSSQTSHASALRTLSGPSVAGQPVKR